MAYTIEETIEPFWAEHASKASGRDPLAVQNSSVVIYTKMIVGITNVTNRIRYNGFYCWIIDAVLKSITKKNSLIEQICYIRRSELLLAFMMVKEFPKVTGVSGSDYAGKNLQDRLNLKIGADWDYKIQGNNNLYWNNKLGAFGQYFSGVLRNLNLIHHPQGDLNVYTLTTKGQELSEAFLKNIPVKEEKIFLQTVFKGTLREGDLSLFRSFALNNIPLSTDESNFYKKMLLAEDYRKIEPTFHRRNSIQLMLQFLKSEKEGVQNLPLSFLKANYKNHYQLELLPDHTSTAWYLYEINELLHVAYEHIHACFLYSIKTYPTPIEGNIDMLLNETINEFMKEKINAKSLTAKDLTKILKKERKEVYEFYDMMHKAFGSENFGVCLANAVKVMLSVYLNCKNHITQLKEYAWHTENNFNRNNYAVELLEDLIEKKLHSTISDYIKSVIFLAINQHTFSSYSKTKIGQSLVHNYMIEDDTVWRLRETLPSRTSPRLQNVVQYLTDIAWIKKEGNNIKITNLGIKTSDSI